MRGLEGEQTLMRIFIGESDRCGNRSLADALVELFRSEGLAGSTVLKGAAGFGAQSILHTDKILRLSSDLPVIIEVVDETDKIDEVLPKLDDMLEGGLVTLEKVHVRRYSGKGEVH